MLNLKRKKEQKHKNMETNIEKGCTNAAYNKTMKKLRNRIDARLVRNKKDHLK